MTTPRLRLAQGTAFWAILCTLLLHCRSGTNPDSAAIDPPATIDLSPLRHAKVYFGHQSVGENILQGIRALYPNANLRLVDERVGENQKPLTKIAAFVRAVESGAARDADIALFKFCYIDFEANTDEKALFSAYRTAMADLKSKNPNKTFVHVTVPLTTAQTGVKAWGKRTLGRPVYGHEDNAKRHAYNELLRAEYGGKEPIFDLAALESGTDGTSDAASTVAVGDQLIPALDPRYTDDGGHLNAMASKKVGAALLAYLGPLVARAARP